MNKKRYRIPSTKVIELDYEESLLVDLSGGGDDGGDGTGDAKRASYLIDDDNIFDDRSTSYSEAESYSHADL